MWTITVGEDGEINLPQAVLDELGIKNHDYVSFTENSDNSLTVTGVPVKRVLVEAVSTFRHRYVIELRESDPDEWALDTVVMEEAVEFSQKHLDETIVSHRVVTVQEVLELCDEDNDYFSDWPEDKKFEVFVTPLRKD